MLKWLFLFATLISFTLAGRCTLLSCGRCETDGTLSWCTSCVNGRELLREDAGDIKTSYCSAEAKIENCLKYLAPTPPETVGLCTKCKYGYFLLQSLTVCQALTSVSFDENCALARYDPNSNLMICIACSSSFPSPTGRYCMMGLPLYDHCEYGGLDGGKPICLGCEEGYYNDLAGGCSAERAQGCQKYESITWNCLECAASTGYYATKAKLEGGVQIQFCTLESTNFSLWLLIGCMCVLLLRVN